MTGLNVLEINVHIVGVQFEKQKHFPSMILSYKIQGTKGAALT